jgi:hypothetical protein
MSDRKIVNDVFFVLGRLLDVDHDQQVDDNCELYQAREACLEEV